MRRADEVFAERARPVLVPWVRQRERVVARCGKVCDKFVEGDAGGACGEELLRGGRVGGVEDARGPVGRGGAGHPLRGFEEGAEGADGEGVPLGECGEDAAELGVDDRGGELEGVGAGVKTGDATAGTVGAEGGHDGRVEWEVKTGYGGRWIVGEGGERIYRR